MDKQTIDEIRAYLTEYDWLFNATDRSTTEWRERFRLFQNTSLLNSDKWLRQLLEEYDAHQTEREWVKLMLAHKDAK